MDELLYKSVSELSDLLSSREISSAELTEHYLGRISEKEDEIGAYLSMCGESAKAQAESIDKRRAAGEKLGALAGIPCAIKDNICTKGIKTTCASKILEDFVPPYDATVIKKLHSEGYVMLGKLNMDEFAMGSTTENSAFKITHNPRDISCVPGGSSGGSAAAVAAYEAPYTLGSDTGGSIRLPASFCGVVGMKPTYGSVSRYGLVAFASSLDQIGPITRSVRDNAMIFDAIAGHDSADATSVKREYKSVLDGLEKGISGMKIAVADEFFGDGISDGVRAALNDAMKACERLGAELVRVKMPSLDSALAAYYIISSAEASSNLSRFDGVKYGMRGEGYEDIDSLYKITRSAGFGAEVKRRIMLGTFALSSGYYDAYYKKALEIRTLVMADFDKVFGGCDMLIAPVSPTTAYKIGEKTADPTSMYLGDICTVPVNIAGLPAISIPCGKGSGGLPVGMQLIGPAFGEAKLYRASFALESEMGDILCR